MLATEDLTELLNEFLIYINANSYAMGADQRISDAEKALGKDADDYEFDYDDEPEDSDTGKPQLILTGDIIEQETIDKLKNVGFQFLYAQTAFGDEDEEDNEEEYEEKEEEDDEVEAGTNESEDGEDEEIIGDLEIVFEDTRAKARK